MRSCGNICMLTQGSTASASKPAIRCWPYRNRVVRGAAARFGRAANSMSVEWKFIDTNVLVYLFDADAPEKRTRAQELLRAERDCIVLSIQVLGEFYVTVTRKFAESVSLETAARAVDAFSRFRVQPVHPETVNAAIRRSRYARLSYWDSLIIEAALSAGAGVLFTEDLQHGQRIDDLQIVDPFRGGG